MCVCRSEDVFSRVQKFFVFPSKYVPPILGICFGIGFGFVFRNLGIPNDAITLIQLIGDLYFNGLKAVMLLYLFVSMVLNSIKIASEKNACSLMIITLLSFTTGTILTSLMGIGAMKVVEPYITKADTSNIQYKHAESDITKTLEQLFNKFLPSNYVAAMSQNNIPGTLVFGMCFGMFAAGVIKSRMQKDKKNYMQDILELTEKSLMRIVDFLILVTAVGVFSIIASQTLSLKNIDVLRKLLIFLIPYVICNLLLTYVLTPLIFCFSRGNRFAGLKKYAYSTCIGFITSSGVASLNPNAKVVEEFDVPENKSKFLLTLALMFETNGSCLYIVMLMTFVSKVYDIPFPLPKRLLLAFIINFICLSLPPIPYGTVLYFPMVGSFFDVNIPLEIMSLLIMWDIVLDRFVTMSNIGPDAGAVILVHKLHMCWLRKTKEDLQETVDYQ